MRQCDIRPIHGGYPDARLVQQDREREFLEKLRNLCHEYDVIISGAYLDYVEVMPDRWHYSLDHNYNLKFNNTL